MAPSMPAPRRKRGIPIVAILITLGVTVAILFGAIFIFPAGVIMAVDNLTETKGTKVCTEVAMKTVPGEAFNKVTESRNKTKITTNMTVLDEHDSAGGTKTAAVAWLDTRYCGFNGTIITYKGGKIRSDGENIVHVWQSGDKDDTMVYTTWDAKKKKWLPFTPPTGRICISNTPPSMSTKDNGKGMKGLVLTVGCDRQYPVAVS